MLSVWCPMYVLGLCMTRNSALTLGPPVCAHCAGGIVPLFQLLYNCLSPRFQQYLGLTTFSAITAGSCYGLRKLFKESCSIRTCTTTYYRRFLFFGPPRLRRRNRRFVSDTMQWHCGLQRWLTGKSLLKYNLIYCPSSSEGNWKCWLLASSSSLS